MWNSLLAFVLTCMLSNISCASFHQQKDISRSPTAIEEIPKNPSWAYFKSNRSVKSYFEQMNVGLSREARINTGAFYDSDAPYFAEINGLIRAAASRTSKVVNRADLPLPSLVVVKDASPNAFVMALPKCIGNVVVNGGDTKSNADSQEFELVSHPDGNLLLRKFDKTHAFGLQAPCISEQELTDTLEIYNTLTQRKIKLGIEECEPRLSSDRIELSCPNHKPFIISQLRFEGILPFIFIHAGLLKRLRSVDELEAIVAHELGHYYLGHSFIGRPKSVFYTRNVSTPAFRPPEDPALKNLGTALLGIGDARIGNSLEGHFSSALGGKLLVAPTLNLSTHARLYESLGFQFSAEKCALKIEYSDFFRALYANPQTREDARILSQGAWAAQACLHSVVASGDRPEIQDYVRIFLFEYLDEQTLRDFFLAGTPMSVSKNGWEAFQKIEERVSETIANIHSSDVLARTGYYTFEEEADVFAINYLKQVGRDPKALVRGLRALRPTAKTLSRDQAQCFLAYDSGWMLNGKPYLPVPEEYKDPHHGLCFRLYNAQQIEARLGSSSPDPLASPPLNLRAINRTYALRSTLISIRQFFNLRYRRLYGVSIIN